MTSPENRKDQPAYRPKRAYIVSHTHWDREWYLTYHTFRVNFTRVVKLILEKLEQEPEFKHFLLDGQAAILEDYLEVHPEDRQRIEQLVQQGSLSLGPWYILPDEFLISAEAHVRNLIYGNKVAQEHGGVQKVGYMPDSFGHIAQMPQLLRGAGIDSFVYTRGNGDELDRTGFEYTWEAPDGSSVLAINQCGGYCNASGLGFAEIWHAHTRRDVSLDRAVEQVRELFARLGERSNGDLVLLNNGCDHFPPQQGFAEVLDALCRAFPDTVFIHTILSEYIDAVRQAEIAGETYRGELVGGRLHHILSGVWSARMPLKQLNDQAQHWLADYLEPLSAYTHFTQNQPHPAGLIEYAWKLLLKNHPHDSICGCSIDEVHREMLPRFTGVIETAEQECMRQLEQLAPTFARRAEADRDTVLCVFNPLPWRRDVVVQRLVVLQPLDYDLDALRVLDESGQAVPFKIMKTWFVERFWGIDYRTMFDTEHQVAKLTGYLDAFDKRFRKSKAEKDSADCFLLIEFVARDLPGVGHVNYRLTDRNDDSQSGDREESTGVAVTNNTLDNDQVMVTVHPNGSFDLHCKATGRTYPGLNLLESTEDIGDEYDYSPAADSATITTAESRGSIEVIEKSSASCSITVRFDWKLPRSINESRSSRSTELTSCPIEVRISLTAGSPAVDVMVKFDNQVCDHRVRALMPTNIQTDTLVSHGHFYINQRLMAIPNSEHWTQPHPGTYPQQDFSLVEDQTGGLAVLNRGLPEVAPLTDEPGKAGIALTLLRCVGWLSRDDFPTRRCSNAGPTIPTPDSQCLGRQLFHYSVLPYAGGWQVADVLKQNAEWRTPPLVTQGVEDQSTPGGGGLIEIDGPAQMTAIKRCEERDSLVVRLYNPHPSHVTTVLHCAREITAGWQVNMLEERHEQKADITGREITLTLAAHEIATIELELGQR